MHDLEDPLSINVSIWFPLNDIFTVLRDLLLLLAKGTVNIGIFYDLSALSYFLFETTSLWAFVIWPSCLYLHVLSRGHWVPET